MKPAAHTHYPALDGLRGIAILLVVAYHNFGFINYFFFGWLGVDLFFVLSGFLITQILLRAREGGPFLGSFFMRRILRIFPLYFLFLLLFYGLTPRLPGVALPAYLETNAVWFFLYLQNILFILNPPPEGAAALNHLWSLAVEEQFYLLWPFVLLAVRSHRALAAGLISLLGGVIALRLALWTWKIEDLAYYNLYTFTRIDGLCIGSLLAVLRAWRPALIRNYFTYIVLAMAALNFIFFFFNRTQGYSFPFLAITGYTTFAVLFGLLVERCLRPDGGIIPRLLSLPPLRFFGTLSYGLYMWHWPIYLLLSPALERHMTPLAAAFAATAVAICTALLSYHGFEKHFLRMKRHFPQAGRLG